MENTNTFPVYWITLAHTHATNGLAAFARTKRVSALIHAIENIASDLTKAKVLPRQISYDTSSVIEVLTDYKKRFVEHSPETKNWDSWRLVSHKNALKSLQNRLEWAMIGLVRALKYQALEHKIYVRDWRGDRTLYIANDYCYFQVTGSCQNQGCETCRKRLREMKYALNQADITFSYAWELSKNVTFFKIELPSKDIRSIDEVKSALAKAGVYIHT
ncbi:hypothetical protein IPF86_01835 [Candidatus Nomurabacteria bacterium]|jgi:hypothetical protein|nr:MAG: hypothetical protein IPF86_01835 [Candidatus Nomurabacteria bacterium]